MSPVMSTTSLPRSIPHVVLAAAERAGERLAVVDGRQRATYAELAEAMLRAAAAFLQMGLPAGERVAIWAPNGLAWIVAALGVQAAGGCIVPLNTRFKGGEAEYILNRSRARYLVLADQFLGTSYPGMLKGRSLPYLERRIVLGVDGDGGWDAFVADRPQAWRAIALDSISTLTGAELADLMFTSGTTGNPKAVMAAHAQNVRVYDTWARMNTLRADDRYLMIYPFFHCSGYKAGWLACFIAGATAYPLASMDVASVARVVAAERISFMPGPPTLFQTLLAAPPAERGDLSSIRVAQTGATTVPPSVIQRMLSELHIQNVMTGYGLTETCGTVTLTAPEDGPEVVTRYCGKPIEGVEVRCVDEKNMPMPYGEAGEVVVRGYNVMRGYFEDPAATAKAIDADGWLHTGDIGVLDPNGYLRLTDRKNDMYIVGGFNCYPSEIEKIMLGNPAYAQVAVIGVPDERMGEVGKAFVVPREGAELAPAAVIAWCREAMANYKVPRHVEIVSALPTNASGKVLKYQLRNS